MDTPTQAVPTYEEMLKMDDSDFKKWLLVRVEKPHRKKLLEEMIDHEEKTGSFARTARKEITSTQQAMLDVFARGKSAELKKVFDRTKELTNIDLVMEAVFAKAASDHVGLGK